MTVRLYFDEDSMDQDLVRGLRARGIDVLTVFEAGLSGHLDEVQLEFATIQGRVLYSFNIRDFTYIHKKFQQLGRTHSGIIVVAQQR